MAGMPKPGRVVKYLLLINIGVFVLQLIMGTTRLPLEGLFGATPGAWWQVWRYFTFQFLHSTSDIWHIALNMLGVYMLGTLMEQHWGSKRFLKFYLSCGVVAGLAYVVVGNILSLPPNHPIIGASGGVYGILLACAILFPQVKLLVYFFPVPIRFACLIIFAIMAFGFIQSIGSGAYGGKFWSDVAHFGGAVTAAVWVWGMPRFSGVIADRAEKVNQGSWERKMKKKRADQAEVDRILAKINDKGINSLSSREKKTLKEATLRQQSENR